MRLGWAIHVSISLLRPASFGPSRDLRDLIGLIERELDCQQGIDPLKFHMGIKLSFVLELHIRNLTENSLIQNQMKNLILVINVNKKCKDYINVMYRNC